MKNFFILTLLSFFFCVFAEDDIKKQNTKLINEFISSIPDNVAEFSGKKIPKTYLISEIMPLIKNLRQSSSALSVNDIEKVREASKKSLDMLLEREILFAIASSNACSASAQEIDVRFAKIANSVDGGASALVASMGVNESSIKQKISQGIAIEKWLQKEFIPKFIPSDKEVEEFYRNNQDVFLIPEKVAISHIFISSENMDDKKASAMLEDLRKSSKTSEQFQKLAKENSQDERTKGHGGVLGEFPLSELPKPFADAIAKISPGQVSAPFKSFRGWHIVRLDSRSESKYAPTEEVYPVIKKYLTEKKTSSKLNELIENEKKRCGCKILWN